MTEEQNTAKRSKLQLILGSLFGVVIIGGALGFIIYSNICPCERTPGGYLFGDRSDEVVTDWSFANQVTLCQIQVWVGIRPHSINLNCMSTPDGRLYLSCSFCGTKTWSNAVGTDEGARLRLNGVIYPVALNRILDANELDRAWAARVSKLRNLS
ncbi:MAG: hypothetical protein JKY98_03395, partial [Gammaproteobacteria bacterium]|nr:hypothetical protein [Gammaproteobacteria bacterium]